jgi:hypothetical protein
MAYVPKLKYVFVQTRVYPIEYHLSLLHYLNKLGIAPRIFIGDEDIIKALENNNISFDKIRGLPQDYDIMISLAPAFLPLGRYCLEKSAKAGKINVFVALLPIPYRYQNENTTTKALKFFHAICTSDQITIDYIKRYNNNDEALFLKTGHPTWDQFSTEQFQNEVEDIKCRFGKRLLVLTVDSNFEEEFLHLQKIIHYAESLGFTAILQVHKGQNFRIPEQFVHYVNPGLNRFALFAAASHVIASILSTVVSEGLFLGTKIGCKSFGFKGGIWGQQTWFNNPDEWYQDTSPFYGKEYLDLIPLIHDENSIKHFLASDKIGHAQEDVDRIFGWPRINNYAENIFRTIETYFGEPKNVQAALAQSRTWGDIVEPFCWNCEIPNSPIKYIKDPVALFKGGINALNQGDIGTAIGCLRLTEKFSNFDKFELIQFALATCYCFADRYKEAQRYIYRALAINPDCIEYKNLQNQIEAMAYESTH